MPSNCPLCESTAIDGYAHDRSRIYFRCDECSLIFADPASRLNRTEEKAVYDQHKNNPDDPEYRQFLSRLAEPLKERLGKRKLHGLDFGSGPGPTLTVMLEESGYRMSLYDPFYASDTSVLDRQYDFVTCTEAIEHFNAPAREWRLLLELVKPGGLLAIMTRLTDETDDFTQWHYKNDPSHVSFFSRETFYYLAKRDCLQCELIGSDVVLLTK
ncbi:MAG TPA: class I SAM-dependent methyltransferase [Gammaproteobacteria bacterium]|jgi:hypothetical protein